MLHTLKRNVFVFVFQCIFVKYQLKTMYRWKKRKYSDELWDVLTKNKIATRLYDVTTVTLFFYCRGIDAVKLKTLLPPIVHRVAYQYQQQISTENVCAYTPTYTVYIFSIYIYTVYIYIWYLMWKYFTQHYTSILQGHKSKDVVWNSRCF